MFCIAPLRNKRANKLVAHEDETAAAAATAANVNAAGATVAAVAAPMAAVKEKQVNPEEEKRKEAEKLLQQRFKTFDLYFKDITHLLDAWDRAQGGIFRQASPSEKSEHDDHAPSKKSKKDLKGQYYETLVRFV